MRKALNDNPMVQMAVLGVLALVVGFFLFTRILGGQQAEETPATPPAATTAPGATATPPATDPAAAVPAPGATAPATPATPVEPAVTPPDAAGAATPTAKFEAGPGLPGKVVSAYERGETVVLLLTKRSATDDRAVRRSVTRLDSEPGVTVFTVRARNLADYARITAGVDLSRVPAIVVLRPKELSGPVPEATVSYGFRGPASALQAVEDARFDGKRATYDP